MACGEAEDGLSCGEELGSDDEKFSHLTNFLLELIACGVRNLTLLCCGRCRGVCQEVHRTSSTAAPPSSSPSLCPPPWLPTQPSLSHLTSYLSFRSISSKAEFERDLQTCLQEISHLSQEGSSADSAPLGVPIFLSSVRHSTRGAEDSLPSGRPSSSQTVFGMLRGEIEEGRVPGGLAVSCRIITLTDPIKDTPTFASALLR